MTAKKLAKKGKIKIKKSIAKKSKGKTTKMLKPTLTKQYLLGELEEKYFGNPGTKSRELYEQEFLQETFSEIVKQLRRDLDLTQEDLASKAGMTKSYISKIENNIKNQNVNTILKIIRALKVKLFIRVEYRNRQSEEFLLG